MKIKTYFRTVFLLFFFTTSFLFASGSWYGEVSLSDNSVPVDSSLVASIINLQYIPSDPVIKQELDDGKATISYEYVWTFSPGGQIESGQGTSSCKVKSCKFFSKIFAVVIKCIKNNLFKHIRQLFVFLRLFYLIF
jgi:hypothetical protein